MLLYIVFFFFLIIPTQIRQFKFPLAKWTIILAAAIFLCFGYMTGSDWRAYEPIYENIDTNYPFDNMQFEIGYHFYLLIFKFLGVSFWSQHIFTKVLSFIVFSHFILKNQKEDFYTSFFFFIIFFGLSLYIDNPMRTMIASSIYLFALKSYLAQKNFFYFFYTILASLFHVTTLVLLPFYWILRTNFKSKNIILAFIILNIILFVFSTEIKSLFNFKTGFPFLDSKISFYFADNATGNVYVKSTIFSFGLLFRTMIFGLLITIRQRVEQNFGLAYFNISILTVFLYRIGLGIAIFERFEFYFCIFFSILIPMIINSFKHFTRPIVYFTLYFITFISMYKNITTDYKYVPYSNYIKYLMMDRYPEYNYRYNNNFIHSPYAKRPKE